MTQKKEFLDQLVTVVEMEEIPAALIPNWDQNCPITNINYMDKKGTKRVEIMHGTG